MIPLSQDDIRAVTQYAEQCARPALTVFTQVAPDDPRPAAALEAARAFAEGSPRSQRQRATAAAARRAAEGAPTEAARNAADAAGRAAAASYLRPVASITQVWHILGAAAHAARAVELVRGDDPVVAEYMVAGAAARATSQVRAVLARYPRVGRGRGRVVVLLCRLEGLLRDPPPPPRGVTDPGPFFHGTKADLKPGEFITPGWASNYGTGRPANHVYLTGSDVGAPLAAALARGQGPGRVYRVEPLGAIEDDPNVTDKRFPGNPTRSYRTRAGLRVVDEVRGWQPPDPDLVERLRTGAAELAQYGIEALD